MIKVGDGWGGCEMSDRDEKVMWEGRQYSRGEKVRQLVVRGERGDGEEL